MKAWLVLVTVACAACATPPGPSRPVEVGIAVPTTCKVEPVVCGPYALGTVTEADRLIVKGRAALAEVKQREACEIRLRAALQACSTSPQ